ncbi:MAG: hypothetical protein P8Y71_13905 [Pseudolabrys sp.]
MRDFLLAAAVERVKVPPDTALLAAPSRKRGDYRLDENRSSRRLFGSYHGNLYFGHYGNNRVPSHKVKTEISGALIRADAPCQPARGRAQ